MENAEDGEAGHFVLVPARRGNSSVKAALRALLLNLLVLGIGCVLAVALLEVLLRVKNPFQTRLKGDRIVLETNKELKIHNDIIKTLDPDIQVVRNSLGFRGQDPPSNLASMLSVVTIGGSTTQCFFLTEGKTWTDQMARRLGTHFGPLWVNNAGLDGHSTFGHKVLLEDHVVKIKPKIVVLLVGANDMGRDPNAEWDAENVKSRVSFASSAAFFKSMSPYSEVAALVTNLFRSFNAHRRGLIHQNVDVKSLPEGDFSPAEVEAYRNDNLVPRYLDGFRERLTGIVQAARAAGIEPVLVTQPGLLGAGVDERTGVNLARVLLSPGAKVNGQMWWGVMETYNDVTRTVGRDNNVLVIDLARKLEKSTVNFYDTIHFSNEGAESVGNIVANGLCDTLATRYPATLRVPCAAPAAN
jgi:lysophospholipase L1-like esterase